MAKIPDDIAKLSYEQARDELTKLVDQMQGGSMPLDLAVNLYERGEALAQHCEALLSAATTRVQTPGTAAKATKTVPAETPFDNVPF